MKKCPECKTYKKGDNCQSCFLAEQKLRKSIGRKYGATLDLIDKFHANAKNIMGGKPGPDLVSNDVKPKKESS